MPRVPRDRYIYEISADSAPACEVDLGEILIVEVWDAFAGRHTIRKDEEDNEDRTVYYHVLGYMV